MEPITEPEIRRILESCRRLDPATEAEMAGLREYSAFHSNRYCYTLAHIVKWLDRRCSIFSFGSYPNQIELLTKYCLDASVTGSAFSPEDERTSFETAYEIDGTRYSIPTWLLNSPQPSLPFSDASFDACYLFEVIEHLPQRPGPILLELKRILKPEGLLFISTPNSQYFHRILKLVQGFCYYDVDYKDKPGERHERVYSMMELQQLLTDCGMQTIFAEHTQMWPEPEPGEMDFFRGSSVFSAVLDALQAPQFRRDSLFLVSRRPAECGSGDDSKV